MNQDDQGHSRAYIGMKNVESNCKREINRILEMNQEERENTNLFKSIVFAKNDCFLNSLCYEKNRDYQKCMIENNNQDANCKMQYDEIYGCLKDYMNAIMNQEAMALLKHFQLSNMKCQESQKKYAQCRLYNKKEDCKQLFFESEMCVASQLDNKLWQKYQMCKESQSSKGNQSQEQTQNPNESNKIDECYKYKVQMVNLKYFWARQILLKMNFNEVDLEDGALETLETISKQIQCNLVNL